MTYDFSKISESDYPTDGIYKKFDGVVVELNDNWDLVFHCGSEKVAKELLHDLCYINHRSPKAPSENIFTEK